MWRIYYYPNTGMIKYQINIESASQLEPMPFVDFAVKQNIQGVQVDPVSKTLVPAAAIPQQAPSFSKPERIQVRQFDLSRLKL